MTDTSKHRPDEIPISAFMAGSPGAGKTEFSRSLIAVLEKNEHIQHSIIRIDGDDLRPLFPGYTGKNSYLFQGAISIIIDRVQDYALKQKQTFVLDGTLADYTKATKNIRRSFDKQRAVLIFYMYQEPQVAWRFTEARELAEGRNIPKSAFIDGFLGARDTVDRIWKEFGKRIVIFVVKKDFEKNQVESIVNFGENVEIDAFLPKRYTRDELDKLL